MSGDADRIAAKAFGNPIPDFGWDKEAKAAAGLNAATSSTEASMANELIAKLEAASKARADALPLAEITRLLKAADRAADCIATMKANAIKHRTEIDVVPPDATTIQREVRAAARKLMDATKAAITPAKNPTTEETKTP